MTNNLQTLLEDDDVKFILEDDNILKDLLNDSQLSKLLETGQISVDFSTVESEIILLYQVLMQLKSEEGNGFDLRGVEIVRKTVADIGKLKKLGKELREKRQVNKEIFNAMMEKFSFALNNAVLKIMKKRELADAIILEVWKNFVEPGVASGMIEEGVNSPNIPEKTTYKES